MPPALIPFGHAGPSRNGPPSHSDERETNVTVLCVRCLAIEYSTKPFFLFGVLVLYEPPAWKGFCTMNNRLMNKKLLIGLLALGVVMIVAGLVIAFVGLP